jgi:uncharacterized membrane protein YcaP (DUF421 family)
MSFLTASMWTNLFQFEQEFTVLEKLVRTLAVYAFLVVGLRLAGKRELAQLNTFDLVVLLVLSNSVQNAIIGHDESLIGGLIGAGALLTLNAVVIRFLYGHATLDRLVEGSPATLIDKGKVLKSRLKTELITESELEIAAHKQGFSSLREIDRAILEPGGTIAFISKTPPPAEQRFREITHRLDQIAQDLAALRTSLEAKN